MVYIYAFVGRLFLSPLLAYKAKSGCSPTILKLLRRLLLADFILSSLSLAIHRFIMHPVMSLIMDINLYIFFGLGYVGAFVIGLDVVRRALAWAGFSVKDKLGAQGMRRLSRVCTVIAILGFFGIIALGHYSGHHIHIVDYSEKQSPQKKVLARIALITDLHIGEGGGLEHVRRVVNKLNALKPDVILVGGDYIDHNPKYAYQPEIMNEMKRLKARDGIYFVVGNHEYRVDTTASFNWVKAVGGTLLLDSIAYPRDSAYSIIGRRDYVDSTRKTLNTLIKELKPRSYNILLEHTPEGLAEDLPNTPLDYALYGHTHGGQIWPYVYALKFKYDLPYGKERFGNTTAIVSSGVGAAGTLFRIGTQSEIILLNLYEKQ